LGCCGKQEFTPGGSVEDGEPGERGLELGRGTAIREEEEVLGGGVGEEETVGLAVEEEVEAYLDGAVFTLKARGTGLSAEGGDGIQGAAEGLAATVEGPGLAVVEDADIEGGEKAGIIEEESVGADGDEMGSLGGEKDIAEDGLIEVHGGDSRIR